ncbi:hypothetical protein IWX90DRAFT_482966 [Phyllosticta citrichinensis]|uniref:T6SS Phospholipase effector Tle1-like catalytic domain-containing protein n=1 Tax=Phyllosticta citrichinensis TaxID=1130410 RepID=A0ABR1Y808_9PEZI
MGSHQIMKKPKKLIVCCDGTWMDSDNGIINEGTWLSPKWELQTPSNVTRIGRVILVEDSQVHPQIVYYQAGVGCGTSWVDHIIGGGIGAGLSENVREAYSFLANNYTDGDSIYLIGFSRGAFTARCIAGLIGGMGLLTKNGLSYFSRVFEDWQNAGQEGYDPSIKLDLHEFELDKVDTRKVDEYLDGYKRELMELRMGLTRDVKIKAIGVWDTVGALGIPTTPWLQSLGVPAFLHPLHPYRFMDTSLGNHIEFAFQALALDERRTAYSPAVWSRPENCETVVKQVWFPGVHSNVGGSYEDTGLADITLAWMMDQLAQPAVGIEFDEKYLAKAWVQNRDFYVEQNAAAAAAAAHQRARTLPTYLAHHHSTTTNHVGINRRPTPHPTLNPQPTPPQQQPRRRHTTKHHNDNLDPTGPHWGLTRLYNSATSLTCLAGIAPRTPGLYAATNYSTGKPDFSRPLRDTRESIHSSVRIRLASGSGRSYDGKGTYGAAALVKAGYVLEAPGVPFRDDEDLDNEGPAALLDVEINGVPRGAAERCWRWVLYDGADRRAGVDVEEMRVRKVLREEPLGRFERALLACDKVMYARVLGAARANDGLL